MPMVTPPSQPAPPAPPDTSSNDPTMTAQQAARGTKKRDFVQKMFSDIAPRYDLLNHVLSMNIDRGWRRRALAAVGWTNRPGGTYLDLCAGTLDVGAALCRSAGFTGFVVGADFALPMLQHGAGKAPARTLGAVAADALMLPVADSSMDGAIVAFGIRNVSDLDAALRETRRVLRPGARFVILEFSTPGSRVVRAFYHAYFHHVLPRVGRLVSGHQSAYTYLPVSVAYFPAAAELAERLRHAGFTNVTWDLMTFGIAAIHVGEVPPAAVPRR